MQKNIFPSNHMKNNNCFNTNLSGHVHSCPFCKCKSLDNLDKVNPKHFVESTVNLPSQNSFLSNPKLSQNLSYFNNKASNVQNVYYQPSNFNKRQSISPNFNKKIVVKFLSPEPNYPLSLSKSMSVPFIQQKNNHFGNSKPFPTKISPTPRTIYTNQNTPPKAKFLLKRESKKKSPQKVTFQTPFQGLKFLQNQKEPVSKIKDQPRFHIPYQPFKFLSMEKIVSIQKTLQFNQPFKADQLEGIYKTTTKNFIRQKSQTPQSVGSPFNSLFDTTPQVLPFGSFSSTPLIANDTSQKRRRQSSIHKIAQFNEQVQEVRLDRKISEPVEIQKYEFIPKQIQINRIQYRKNQKFDEKFEKILEKNDYDPRLATQNELIYSQSDQKTIENLGGSQKNLFQNKSMRINSNQTRSERNMRMVPDDFGKKKSKFDLAELSDNFETPKSKYKTLRESKINDSKKSIKFKVVGENRKSKVSIGSKQSINQLLVQNSIKLEQQKEKVSIENKSIQIKQGEDQNQLLKHDSLIKEKKENMKEIIMEDDGFDRDEDKEVSIRSHQVKTIEGQNSLAVSNQYAGQLAQELKLNQDQYLFQPKNNRKLLHKNVKQDMNTKLPDSGNQYLPDSSASSHGFINISF